ncbi:MULTISPECIES: SP_1767 family glycosyltransferase [Aerococcus]|uniref:SP_1767 family glycosyltransferase n=1 Tax=Aerococcus TaxID=1375 RepID=UPI000DCDF387|nr:MULTISPECIES: SP_1767 family glycosyltransferase [Aerococcus]KAA9298694.1 SP_1767 family glycosyltransferase [Aerococcus tenax]MDK6689557.1 SP_1767 family glycosyltransferase [Aerococcus urinae]MDK8133604.1 SP_1767 family glycosyltransferase [Aerococcus urinae]MDK8484004.1 SP_1767 family glycosyltransferase [Aerococcus urinae]MDL5178928.1 SP_1767 family glycosyltransferase [Aerococcus tenax]
MKKFLTVLYGHAQSSTAQISQHQVAKIAKNFDFNELAIPTLSHGGEGGAERTIRIEGILAGVSPGDLVIVQFPSWNELAFDRALVDQLRQRQTRLALFVNDVPFLMFESPSSLIQEYVAIFNQADLLIVPSEPLYKQLLSYGVQVDRYVVQEMWDYIQPLQLDQARFSRQVHFAGIPEKFRLEKEWPLDYPLTVYGEAPEDNQHPAFNYQGWLPQENLMRRLSKGGFGLVWGGSEGPWYDYYHYNCIYKLSTYLAAGIPVIIPEDIGQKDIVVDNGLGIAIRSLDELPDLLENFSKANYDKLLENVAEFNLLIKNGYFIQKLLVETVHQMIRKDGHKAQYFKGKVTVFTNSQEIEAIEELIQNMPDYSFRIAAPTNMSPKLMQLKQYANCSLYPSADQALFDHLLEDTDIYLDINYQDEIPGTLEACVREEIPVLSFDSACHRPDLISRRQIHSQGDVQGMACHIDRIMKKKELTASCRAVICTNTDQIEQLETLIVGCPEISFHIAAPTLMGDRLLDLNRYKNVMLYPQAGSEAMADLLAGADLYLDINHFAEVGHSVETAHRLGLEIFTFAGLAHHPDLAGQHVYERQQIEAMVTDLRKFAERVAKQNEQLTSFQPRILSIDESLDYIRSHHPSVARFGDGEMAIISGLSVHYQHYDPKLADRLKEILGRTSDEDFMVCLPDIFTGWDRYQEQFYDFWQDNLSIYRKAYARLCTADWYGNSFISRPYIDLVDKTPSARYFDKLKALWQDRDLLIVEGMYSRSGVGNDLFKGAKSVRRIIGPHKNAFSQIEQIESAILEEHKGALVLLMLGPTAKVIAYDLYHELDQVIDLGHIDSEYEWFLMGADHKVKLPAKHTAEHNYDENIDEAVNADYLSEIILDLSDGGDQ